MGALAPRWLPGPSGCPNARETALAAEGVRAIRRPPGPHALAYAALALADPDHAPELRALATALFDETGLVEPDVLKPADAPSPEIPGVAGSLGRPDDVPPVGDPLLRRIRDGGLGRPVDLAALKPRPRAVLRLLAVNAGRPCTGR